MSSVIFIVCSVPRESVLGPRLFVLYYTADLAQVIHQHDVNFHAHADDSQLYLHCHRDDSFHSPQSVLSGHQPLDGSEPFADSGSADESS